MFRHPLLHLLGDSLRVALALGIVALWPLSGELAMPPVTDMLVLAAVLLVCAAVTDVHEQRAGGTMPGIGGTVLAVLAASVLLVPLHAEAGVLSRHELTAMWVLLWFALLRAGSTVAASFWRLFPSLAHGVLVLGDDEGIRTAAGLAEASEGRFRVKTTVRWHSGRPVGTGYQAQASSERAQASSDRAQPSSGQAQPSSGQQASSDRAQSSCYQAQPSSEQACQTHLRAQGLGLPHDPHCADVTGVVPDASHPVRGAIPGSVPATGSCGDDAEWLANLARREKVRTIVVSLAERRGSFPVDAVMRCRLRGVRVLDASTFYEMVTRKLNVEHITPGWLIFAPGFGGSRLCDAGRRAADIALALVASLLVAPFIPFVALAVRLDSPGPVLFRQVRVGRGGRPFTLYKFRTMRQDAEKDTGPVWARANDSRVTRFGAFMRRCRIDELPQLFNVLRGDMGFIGPRPERPEFVAELSREVPFYEQRHAVRPGLTGWAQVRFPYGASKADALEKLRYDLYYIKNRAFMLDMEIIARTFSVVLSGSGAR